MFYSSVQIFLKHTVTNISQARKTKKGAGAHQCLYNLRNFAGDTSLGSLKEKQYLV